MIKSVEDGRSLLGSIIRRQRERANLTLRQLADLTVVSNPYLSQVERGLHQPSVRVLKSIAEALNVSIDVLLGEAEIPERRPGAPGPSGSDDHRTASAVEQAVIMDQRLSDQQKVDLVALYRQMTGDPT